MGAMWELSLGVQNGFCKIFVEGAWKIPEILAGGRWETNRNFMDIQHTLGGSYQNSNGTRWVPYATSMEPSRMSCENRIRHL